MKTFIPRYSKKFQENPKTPTLKTFKTPLLPSFEGFEGEGIRVNQKNLSIETDKQPYPMVSDNFEDTPITALSKPSKPIEPLPWQLVRLINAASSGALAVQSTGIPDTNRYVMAWGCSYLAGDKQEALERLWEVYNLWQPHRQN